MLELGRKEQHLLGGLGVQLLIIGLMVFAYTQAIRQVKLARELSGRLQEQLALARDQLARQGGRSDLDALKAQMEELKGSMASPDGLDDQAGRLERLAAKFGIQGARVSAEESPTEKIAVPMEGQPDLEIRLHRLEMKGTASSRDIALLVAAVGDPAFKPVCPLVVMELESPTSESGEPVDFLLRWLIAVSPGSSGSIEPDLLPPGTPPAWGPREEPFLSPFSHPNALHAAGLKAPLQLSGILRGKTAPTCVINGQVLRLGDSVGGYQVVLIAPEAVLLEGKGEELLLRLP